MFREMILSFEGVGNSLRQYVKVMVSVQMMDESIDMCVRNAILPSKMLFGWVSFEILLTAFLFSNAVATTSTATTQQLSFSTSYNPSIPYGFGNLDTSASGLSALVTSPLKAFSNASGLPLSPLLVLHSTMLQYWNDTPVFGALTFNVSDLSFDARADTMKRLMCIPMECSLLR